MYLNVLSQAVPSPMFEGQWRDPSDRSARGYRTLAYWRGVAERLEAACIDALFFADIHGVYGTYGGSHRASVRHSVQVPAIDPVLLIPALGAATKHLGFAVTYSISYHPPYQCARVFSSLDHLTGGRVGWNIVISDVRLGAAAGLAEYIDHDQRYDRADEYLEVVRSLWERSWEDEAVVLDGSRDVFTDPKKVHAIEHSGRWFDLSGPHQCEPSPQRTPVLYQAGSSERGTLFAAQHAEVVFVSLVSAKRGAEKVRRLRRLAASEGRDPGELKILQGMPVMLAATEDAAREKASRFVELTSRGGLLAKWCGWVGVDLAEHDETTPIVDVLGEDSRSVLGFLESAGPDRDWTVADVRNLVATPRTPHLYDRKMLFGTPGQVADRMEEYVEIAGVDGFNLFPCPPTSGIDDICELLVPELQRRGMFRREYDSEEGTLRERYYGAGNPRLAYRPG